MLRKFALLITILLIPMFSILSQSGVPVIVKGKVLDQFTNKPAEVTMMFKNKNGEKFKIIPNILSGEYEQVLKSGEQYEITFINFDVVRETILLNVEFSEKYLEIVHDLKVKKMAPGLLLYSENIFDNNSPTINENGSKLLADMAEMMKYSRGTKLTITISATDIAKKAKPQELLNKRIEAVKMNPALTNYMNRITIEQSSENSKNNFNVTVTEIKDPLK